MAVEMVLLGLLRQGPRHGYDLTREFSPDTVLGDIVRLEPSLLYANIKKLEREGLVQSSVQPQGTRPPRRMLVLTPQGETTLDAWLAEPVERTRDLRLEFLMKLYIARLIGRGDAAQLIRDQREVCKGFVSSLRAQHDAEDDDFRRLVLEMRLAQNTALLKWLDRASEHVVL
ncbi:MAG: PadR family transcriptional regulator [Thermomicrobiales bacterium]|jgi:DNA-binding PadR family transcriptional regulator|nr:PadR family transcriptional regulator [Thermomicrobiales bacterium]